MQLEIQVDADAVAARGAAIVASAAREAVKARGRFTLAVSGGKTPWQMLHLLADEDVPWPQVHVFQVDERIVAASDERRNLAHLRMALLARVPLPPEQLHAMPVEEDDLPAAAERYAQTLHEIAAPDGTLDLVHLGLGADGHTASLIPGDDVLSVTDRDIALTGVYQGLPRMTLTYPALDRARAILWLLTGAEKAPMLPRLLAADPTIPSGRVEQTQAIILADATAAAQMPTSM